MSLRVRRKTANSRFSWIELEKQQIHDFRGSSSRVGFNRFFMKRNNKKSQKSDIFATFCYNFSYVSLPSFLIDLGTIFRAFFRLHASASPCFGAKITPQTIKKCGTDWVLASLADDCQHFGAKLWCGAFEGVPKVSPRVPKVRHKAYKMSPQGPKMIPQGTYPARRNARSG